MSEQSLRMRDLCERFGVNRRTVYRWIDNAGFPKGDTRIGRHGTTWNVAEVDEWAQKLPERVNNRSKSDERLASLDWPKEDRFEASALIKDRISVVLPETTCGVYLLYDGDEIVYVGQSINRVVVRLFQHLPDKQFDGFTVVPCKISELDYLEAFLIYRFKPKYNRRKDGGYTTNVGLNEFIKAFGE